MIVLRHPAGEPVYRGKATTGRVKARAMEHAPGALPVLQDFIRAFLRRDLPDLGLRVRAETMRRFWQMLAHLQG